ncbi:MAG: ABC transporter ATP-binding protein [Candidatus Cellulosilyticum pullistercoris]|uniref:ABC transporter ATP-binding protein n=1 Tax=Candidatus Cellulosilyticum pullistercoris TaxID=2838521 RepID=A0A9E2NL68_9FIRM|nr:ABC transporter ATP-binding protein [Candidatus Cellulosilyticum pullistercoris]
MEAVVFKDIKKKVGDFKLDIPKLMIKKGYITGFIGENGAGKTTTMRLMMDMLIPDSGEIEIEGMNVRDSGKEVKQDIGFVGEPTGFPEESKLKDIKRMFAPFYTSWDEKLFETYSKKFQLQLTKKYKELSTGQKKQFDLVMALSHRPKLIILDEPTAGLDPVVRNEILDVLMEHMQSEEVTIFYSTHITTDLERAGDYIVYIKDGKIMINTELNVLLEEYCIVKGSKDLFPKEIQKELLGYKISKLGAEGLVRSKKQAEELFGREVVYEKPSLEEIMILLASKEAI